VSPHFLEYAGEGKDRLAVKLMIDYVAGLEVIIWTHFGDLFSDPNLTLECLWRTLQRTELKLGVLPPNLYIQFDNCGRENRNNVVFCALAWWIDRVAFESIEVCFLPVGHTHNEADQVSSRCSVGCRNQDIPTYDDLHSVLRLCYAPKWGEEVYVADVPTVANMKALFNPHDKQAFSGCDWKYMHGIRKNNARHFLFDQVGGKVRIRMKDKAESSWSMPWYPFRTTPSRYSLDDVPESAVKELPEEKKMGIRAAIVDCEGRLDPIQYANVVNDMNRILSPIPKREFKRTHTT
jgi:hypothetical protein